LEVGLGEKLENHHICGCDTFVAVTRRARARAPKTKISTRRSFEPARHANEAITRLKLT